MLSLRYSLTKEDYVNYYSFVAWDSPANKIKRRKYYIRQLVPILIFLFAFYYTGLFERPGNFIILISLAIIATSILSLTGVRSNMRRQAEKVAAEQDNQSIFLELYVQISEAGIQVKDELKETAYRWGAIRKKMETPRYYFLFHNAIQAIIIPKRVFQSAQEKLLFEKMLSQYLSFEADLGSSTNS